MKLHKGEISLAVLGIVNVSSFGGIEVDEQDICKMICRSMGLNSDNYEHAMFPGRVTLVVECLSEGPDIKNTVTPAIPVEVTE